jgi:uncharacterized protein (TIGR00297 family)
VNPTVAAAIAGCLAFVGRGLGWLTTSGAVAAALVGAAVFAGAGFVGAALLGMFFVSGSLLTKLSARGDPRRLDRQTGGRTPRQVLANGAWAAVGAVMASASSMGWPVLAGSIAAAQADTWATEIGAYSKRPPRLITSRQVVTTGTSGGITMLGTVGGVMGAATAAAITVIAGSMPLIAWAALLGGLSGVTVDSILGATVQAKYACASCGAIGENRVHSCGGQGERLSGWRWIDNDAVNLIATGTGAAVAAAVSALL